VRRSDCRQIQKAASICLIVLLVVACSGGQNGVQDAELPRGIRVLFIGNSYTFANELPEMLAQLARSGGHE
jgi:hypothetical protein